MGYRNPGYDDEIDEDGEFEWDADRQQWLFRRNGLAAPVVVTDDEKVRYEKLQKWGRLVAGLVFAAIFVFGSDWFEPFFKTDDASELARLTGLGIGLVVLFLGYSIVDRLTARLFRKRQSVGPARSQADVRRMAPGEKSWAAAIWVLAFVGFLVWIHTPPEGLADWIWLSLAALIATAMLAGMLLPGRRLRQL